MTRMIDGGRTDHCGVVVDVQDARTLRGRERIVSVAEIGFAASRVFDLRDYERVPDAVLVRRHRTAGSAAAVVPRALEVQAAAGRYAADRLVPLVLASLTRFTPLLATLEPPEAKRLANSLHLLSVSALATAAPTGTGTCVDVAFEAHDCFASDDQSAPYYGLVLDRGAGAGLLAWAGSAVEFAAFVAHNADANPVASPQEQADFATAMGMLRAIAIDLDRSFPDPEPTDDALRRTIVRSASRVACILGLGTPIREGDVDAATDLGVRAMAFHLLDRLLKSRSIVTPRDIETTRSLYDVGTLDIDSIGWFNTRR